MNASAAGAVRDDPVRTVDFNLHDLVGIRLVNPSTRDVQIVERHVGMGPAEFPGSPALTINFVERLPVDAPLRYLGRDDVAFTDDEFVILRSRNLGRARTVLAMDRIGEFSELTCETGLPAIPLLRQLLNLAMLARGIVPVHAAAFDHRGCGMMVTGWSHGSKTGTLLAFMDAGAKFVGDEWIYLCAERDRMFGLPDQLEARPWYLGELPQYRRRAGIGDRLRTGLTAAAAALLRPLVDSSERRSSLASKLIRQTHQALLDQQSIHLKPVALFGAENCVLEAPLDVLIVAVSHEAADIVVRQISLDQAVGQITASFLYEHATLMSCYQKQLFAFPSRRNTMLDQLESLYRSRATEVLRGKPAHTIFHPYPISPQRLRQATEPLILS